MQYYAVYDLTQTQNGFIILHMQQIYIKLNVFINTVVLRLWSILSSGCRPKQHRLQRSYSSAAGYKLWSMENCGSALVKRQVTLLYSITLQSMRK